MLRGGVEPSPAPVGVAVFAHDITQSVRPLAEPLYHIGHWSEFVRGGQFAAMEVPELLAEDVRDFFHVRNLPETGEGLAVRRALLSSDQPRVRAAARRMGVHVLDSHVSAALSAAHGHPMTPGPETIEGAEQTDPLNDPAPTVRVTAVVNGINRQDGARWARVVADPSIQVRKAAAVHGYCTPQFVWTALAADPDPVVRKAVASSRWAPAELQRRLLSDADPQVSTAAHTRDPLSRAIRVHPSLPSDGEIMLPVSYSHVLRESSVCRVMLR